MTTSDSLPPTDACATCGIEARASERFCRRCGSPLPGALPPPPDASSRREVREVPEAPYEGRPPQPAPPAGDEVTTTTLGVDAVAERAAGRTSVMAGAAPAPMHTDRVGRFLQPAHHASPRVPCPVCAADNPASRELCLRCGVDLETGAVLPQPRPGHGNGSSNGARRAPTPHRAWWVAPVAIVGVAGAILAGLWIAGIGPFASEPELPSANFEPDRYPVDEDPAPLLLSDIATLTTRAPDGERTFPVEQMVDSDPETAWHSEPADLPSGVDEMIDLFLEEPAWVSQIVINNGDHADAAAYEATGRIQQAEVVMDGDVRMEIVLLDLGLEPQAVSLPEPVLTTTFRLEVVETLPGTGSDSLAVSDLELRGWPADEPDADLAHRRADARQAAGSITVPG